MITGWTSKYMYVYRGQDTLVPATLVNPSGVCILRCGPEREVAVLVPLAGRHELPREAVAMVRSGGGDTVQRDAHVLGLRGTGQQ